MLFGAGTVAEHVLDPAHLRAEISEVGTAGSSVNAAAAVRPHADRPCDGEVRQRREIPERPLRLGEVAVQQRVGDAPFNRDGAGRVVQRENLVHLGQRQEQPVGVADRREGMTTSHHSNRALLFTDELAERIEALRLSRADARVSAHRIH